VIPVRADRNILQGEDSQDTAREVNLIREPKNIPRGKTLQGAGRNTARGKDSLDTVLEKKLTVGL